MMKEINPIINLDYNTLKLACQEVNMFIFNAHLRSIRQSKNKTQKVALEIGLSESNYQSFEYGRVKPSFDTLIALADYFNVSIDYLVGRTDVPEINHG